MTFSHSKLETCINNPMDYFLLYKVGMKPKEAKKAFTIGSAMHWGFEHDTEDLTDWFNENGTPDQKNEYSLEQKQAEAMCHGYFTNLDKIMDEVLKDEDTGKRLNVIEEFHELEIKASLPSYAHPDEPYDFMGIIDLLFLTEKGFVLIDYKSSSEIPDFTKYLDQIYRYIFMLEKNFPDCPVYKIGIINLVKSKIRKARNENEEEFEMRWKKQYETYPNHLINVNMFPRYALSSEKIQEYIVNLSREADLADSIDRNNLYYVNYKNATTPYRSDYLDIYNHEENCFIEYTIKDKIYDETLSKIVDRRDCVESDMMIFEEPTRVLYRYEDFEKLRKENTTDDTKSICKNLYLVSDELLDTYEKTYQFLQKSIDNH